MAGRTTEEVKHELESERERLGDAVHTLRSQAGSARRKLPLVAGAVAAAGVAAAVVKKKLAGRR